VSRCPEPYPSVDMSAGASKDQWSVQAYVENLTNNRGDEFTSDAQFVKSIVVTRPLTAGVKISYTFN
jgi:outer membrane receptor protein involved in Fe transport